jgi:hypothetical protein
VRFSVKDHQEGLNQRLNKIKSNQRSSGTLQKRGACDDGI